MNLQLTDNLPLALTTQIGPFAAAQPLPQRYGDLRGTRFPLLRMTATKFLAAGHPMEITRAFVGDLQTASFRGGSESANGITYATVEFAAPVPLGTDASASGVGKRNSATGALIENPADIASDLMAIAGRNDSWWGQLRTDASAASITLAGSFDEIVSVRSAIDTVLDSCGGIWCPGMARLYPVPFFGFKIDLDRFNAFDLEVTAARTDTADILRLAFDYDAVEGKNQSYMQLEANPQRYGGSIIDVAMPMLRSASAAESIGRRVLSWFAGERYTVAFSTAATEFTRPGTWALLTDHPQWPFAGDPYLMMTAVTLSGTQRIARVTAETLQSTPRITLTNHSLGSNSIGSGGVEVTVRNGIAVFTILDQQGNALIGAYVSLDGGAPQKTNGQGQVSFVVTKSGVHELDISATGYLSLALQVTL